MRQAARSSSSYLPLPELREGGVIGHIEVYGRYRDIAVLDRPEVREGPALPPLEVAPYPVVLLAPRVNLLDYGVGEEALPLGRYPVALVAALGHVYVQKCLLGHTALQDEPREPGGERGSRAEVELIPCDKREGHRRYPQKSAFHRGGGRACIRYVLAHVA